MKLHLIILASLLNLAMGGFMVELTGPLPAEPCPGDEDALAAFEQCLPAKVADGEASGVIGKGGERALGWCSGCRGTYFKGHFCYTVCGSNRRLEEDTSLRHLKGESSAAVYNYGAYNGNGDALEYAKEIIGCLGDVTANHACLGDTADMNLVVFA
jgi:hypothetical protein